MAAPAQAAVFYPKTFTLANGLKFVVVQNRLAPAVSQMVWYKVGSSDETKGHSGLAHYLEHLMFRGTKDIPAGAFSRLIAEQGGTGNAFTSYDYTAYYENVAADRLGMIMQMEADRMHNLAITPDTAATELNVVLSERQERTDNSPQGEFAERVRTALFPRYPYGIPVIGYKNEMEKMTPQEAQDFYRHHYAPNNAVVVISGNVDLADVMRLAAGTFGRVPRGDVLLRRAFPQLTEPVQKHIVMKDARILQPHVEIHTVMPSIHTAADRNEPYALEVLSEVLDSGEVGLLYKQLVMKQKIASGVGVHYDSQSRGATDFSISAIPQPNRTVIELDKALKAALHALDKKGICESTIAEAKGRLIREAIFARDSLNAPGYVFGQALTTGSTVSDIESWPERIDKVTASQVNGALRALLVSPYRVSGYLLPDPNAASAGRPLAKLPVLGHEESVR